MGSLLHKGGLIKGKHGCQPPHGTAGTPLVLVGGGVRQNLDNLFGLLTAAYPTNMRTPIAGDQSPQNSVCHPRLRGDRLAMSSNPIWTLWSGYSRTWGPPNRGGPNPYGTASSHLSHENRAPNCEGPAPHGTAGPPSSQREVPALFSQSFHSFFGLHLFTAFPGLLTAAYPTNTGTPIAGDKPPRNSGHPPRSGGCLGPSHNLSTNHFSATLV